MEDWRRNVVREIPVDLDAPTSRDLRKVNFQDIARNYLEIGVLLCEGLQASDQQWVEFDGIDGGAGAYQVPGHFPVPRAYFDPANFFGLRRCGGFDSMAGNTYGSRDLLAPAFVAQKMLTQPLPCHW
jgi:hypothetical protein